MEETGWSANWHVAASSNHFQLLQVETSLYLGSWFPKKVESEQVAQLMKNDPKFLGNIYKNAHWRELRFLIIEKWSFRWMCFREIQWKGFVERVWGDKLLSDLVHILSWRILLLSAGCFIELLDQSTICMLHQFSAKKTRNRLGGPEEVLFKRSLGVWYGGTAS